MPKLTINLPNRPKDDLVEIVGLGVFKNGHTYDVDNIEKDIVHGSADSGTSQDPPVKDETQARDDRVKKLANDNTHEQLDVLAEEYKVTFEDGLTKEQKADALVDSLNQEGDD